MNNNNINNYYSNTSQTNNSYENNYSDAAYDEKQNKNGRVWKILVVILIIIIIILLLLRYCGIGGKSDDELYAELTTRICTAAESYITSNPGVLDRTQPGKSAIIKFRVLADRNLIEAQIENPYYDGGFLKKATQPQYYSMENSVRVVVLRDGSLNCELVDNANDVTAPELRLSGDDEIVLAVGTEFEDPGYTATDDYDGDITNKVVRSGNVNNAKKGEYELIYTVQDSAGNVTTKRRKVIYEKYSDIEVTLGSMLDSVTPQISLKGENPYCLVKGTKYVEPGATATDNVDGNITDRISVTNKVTGNLMGSFRIVYKVEDSSGNQAIAYRSVIVTTSCQAEKEPEKVVNNRPVITLLGKNSVTINAGTQYIDLGATAYDKEDGDITNRIVTDATGVNTNSAGVYKVIYRVSDSQGLTATISRTVTVKQAVAGNPVVRFTEDKNNVSVKVREGSNSLITPPKAVNENGVAVAVTTRIEDYVTKQPVSSINWNKTGKYRVIYTAIHSGGVVKQTKSIVVTITEGNLKIGGTDTINVALRKYSCDLNEYDLIMGGVTFESESNSTPVVAISNNEGIACKAGTYTITIKATIDNGVGDVITTAKDIKVNVIGETSSDTPSDTPSDKPSDKPSDTPSDKPSDTPSDTPSDKPSDTPSDKPTDTPEQPPIVKPGKTRITSNTANPGNVYNTNSKWVGGAVTGIALSFESTISDGNEIAHFELSKDCQTVTKKIAKISKNKGIFTWTEEGASEVCIRAVSTSNIAGDWSDPVKLYIDRVGPKVQFTHMWADDKEDWHNTSSLTVQYKGSDDESGLSHFEYTYDDVKAKKTNEIVTYNEATGKLVVTENTEPTRSQLFVYVRAVDKAGNKGEWTLNPAFVNIDTVKPNAPELTVVGDNTTVVKINATFTDGKSVRPSGFGKLIYKIDNGYEKTEISKVILMPANNTYQTITNNVKVWSVDKAGNRSDNYSTKTVNIAPTKVLVTGVELTNGNNTITNGSSCSVNSINPGGTIELVAKPIPKNADQQDVVWSISDTKIAFIDQNGKVIARKAGTATITAKIGDVSTTCILSVKSQVIDDNTNKVVTKRLSGKHRYDTSVNISKEAYPNGSNIVILVNGDLNIFADAYASASLANILDAPILFVRKDSVDENVINEISRLKASKLYIVGGTDVVSSNVEDMIKSKFKVNVERISGKDRNVTAVKVAEKVNSIKEFNSVILAPNEDILDYAAVAASISAKENMPILYSKTDKLNENTKNYINSNANIHTIYIVGNKFSDSAISEIKATGKNVEIISGGDSYNTGILLINKFNKNYSNVIEVNNLVDIIPAAQLANKTNAAVVYFNKTLNETQKQIVSNSNVRTIYTLVAAESDGPSSLVPLTDLSGSDLYETSVIVSQELYPKGSNNVILVNGDKNVFADGYVAPSLAGALDAPILFARSNRIDDVVLNEIKRLKTKKVYIIGGDAAISLDVDNYIKDKVNTEIERINGKTRTGTGHTVAIRVNSIKKVNSWMLVSPYAPLEDAAMAAAISAKLNMPVGYIETNDYKALPEEVSHISSITKFYLLARELGENSNFNDVDENGINFEGIYAKDIYETNLVLSKKFINNFSNVVLVDNLADIIPASQLANKTDSVVIYFDKILTKKQKEYINSKKINNIYYLGGNNITANIIK